MKSYEGVEVSESNGDKNKGLLLSSHRYTKSETCQTKRNPF